MILSTKEASVVSDLPQGEIIQSGVSAEGMAHIMAVLTLLYRDAQLAVIREIYANALDSHISVGQTRPVEVTLPTRFEPTFVVQDFGRGMSREDIREVYSQYGESTKRESNDQSGAFGLGAKAPLAITPQFTFESVKDGLKHTAVYALNDEGNPHVNIINTIPTDEGNGVTVSIPVDDVYNFNEKARKFFHYSDPEIVLVDGVHPNTFHSTTEVLSTDVDDVEIRTSLNKNTYYRQTSYLIMGNVPYELSYSEMEDSLKRQGIEASATLLDTGKYFSVEIGSVDLTPSREGLRFTSKTKAMVDKAMAAYVTTIKEQAQAAIDAIEDRSKVGGVIQHWKSRIGTTLKWRGEEFKKEVDTPVDYYDMVSRYDDGDASYTIESKLLTSRIYTFVSGVDFGDAKKYARYFGPYLKKTDLSHEFFAFFPDSSLITDKWITENKHNTWITIEDLVAKAKEQMKADRATKKTTAKGPSQKLTYPVLHIRSGTVSWQPYDLIADRTPFVASSDFYIDTTARKAISYQYNVHGWESRSYGPTFASRLAEALSVTTDATQVILLGGSRTEKALLDRVKGTYKITSDIKTKRDKIKALITKDVAKIFALEMDYGVRALKAMAPFLEESSPKIKDKTLNKYINSEEDGTISTINSFKKGLNFLNLVDTDIAEVEIEVDPNRISLSRKYPLLDEFNKYNMTKDRAHHIVYYLNSVRNLSK